MDSPASGSDTRDNLVDIVRHLYPDALTRTYVVPLVHFNRVPYTQINVPGTSVSALVHDIPGATVVRHGSTASTEPVSPMQPRTTKDFLHQYKQTMLQTKDLYDDFAQQHVLHDLEKLGKQGNEVMFVVSELNFKDYLNKPYYAKHRGKLPKPANLPKELRHHGKQGDFDIVVIHRQYGILVGEIKSVGKTEASQTDDYVAKVVDKTIKHLHKCEVHARHMVSDIAPGLCVRKTLILPYVSQAQLSRVLANAPRLQQAACQCLGAATAEEVIQLSCCSDQLSNPASNWDATDDVLSPLNTWWEHRMACTVGTLLTDEKYLNVVARFVGPATTVSVPCYNGVRVEVRTAGQAVAKLGWSLELLVLTLQQMDLFTRNPPLVYITGPPGTGKTVVLILQGLQWLLQGQDVHVISTGFPDRAASYMIRRQLEISLTAGPTPSLTPGSIFFNQYNFCSSEADLEQAIRDLLVNVKNGRLNILLDEVSFDSSAVSGARHIRLIKELIRRVPQLHLWAAGLGHADAPPQLRPEHLTFPLRCAPRVPREVLLAMGRCQGAVHNYSNSGVPAARDGPRVISLRHHGNAHTALGPVACTQCGRNIAAELRRLGVGSTAGTSLPNSPAPLQYRDVFILTGSSELQDDVLDDAGQVTSPASGVVRSLRDEGLPVCVLGRQDVIHNRAKLERVMHDVAVAATNCVTVTDYNFVQGLERRVVAMLPDRKEDFDTSVSDENGWLHAASRCTAQLIKVHVPSITHNYNKDDNEDDGNFNALFNDRSMQGQTKKKEG